MWRAVLVVYRELSACPPRKRRAQKWKHSLSDEEVADATTSFRAFPKLASELSAGAAQVEIEITEAARPLTTISVDEPGSFWPSPDDTRPELMRLLERGRLDSFFALWPQHDSVTGSKIPCRGWGLGMGASEWTHGATYAVVGNAPEESWTREAPGEVWLHEWLHGVCHHFAGKGFPMPDRDADGAEIHGYTRDAERGWSEYYRDLMTGRVSVADARLGIPAEAWRA
jgi:hypothetical protein